MSGSDAHGKSSAPRAHHTRQLARRLALGLGRGDDGELVFWTMCPEKPVHRANVLRAIKQAARHAGLQAEGQEPVGAHDLRHSLAGAAHQAGASLPEIAAMLRHANTHVTAKAYSELFEDRRHAGADKLLASGFGA